MLDAARTCKRCDGPCRHLLCDRCYEASPFSREPVVVSRRPLVEARIGLQAAGNGARRGA